MEALTQSGNWKPALLEATADMLLLARDNSMNLVQQLGLALVDRCGSGL